jgi:prepilin signal peptidase PulO-like enzyme (type II secretory pathway)
MGLTVFFAAVIGLIYGSFLNMLLWRLPEKASIGGRSHCRSCHHILAWYDLIPVLSYIVLRGRCRSCKNKIHIRYPIVEATVALVISFFFYFNPFTLSLEFFLAIAGILILISLFFFDLFYFILPDVIMIPALGIYAIFDIAHTTDPLLYFITALLGTSFFGILYLASSGSKMGFGDVKLAALIGLMLGYPLGFFGFVLGIWLGALVSIVLLISRKASLKDPLPLGSFLAIATLIVIIFKYEFIPWTIFFR